MNGRVREAPGPEGLRDAGLPAQKPREHRCGLPRLEIGMTIKLLIADVDGTLVTREKRLTAGTLKAVERLRSDLHRFCELFEREGFDGWGHVT